jgi:hypothetical protein
MPEFAAASTNQIVDQNHDGPLPTDVHAALAGILEACDGDPLLAVGSLIECGHSMSAETRSTLATGMALAGIPSAFNRLKDFRRIATRYDSRRETISPLSASLRPLYGGFNEPGP